MNTKSISIYRLNQLIILLVRFSCLLLAIINYSILNAQSRPTQVLSPVIGPLEVVSISIKL